MLPHALFAHTATCLTVKHLNHEGVCAGSPRAAADPRSARSPIGALPSLLSKRMLQCVHAALGAQSGHRSLAAQVWRPGSSCMVGWRAECAGLGYLCAARGGLASGAGAAAVCTACMLAGRMPCTPGPRGRARCGAAQARTTVHFEAHLVGLASNPFLTCTQ